MIFKEKKKKHNIAYAFNLWRDEEITFRDCEDVDWDRSQIFRVDQVETTSDQLRSPGDLFQMHLKLKMRVRRVFSHPESRPFNVMPRGFPENPHEKGPRTIHVRPIAHILLTHLL